MSQHKSHIIAVSLLLVLLLGLFTGCAAKQPDTTSPTKPKYPRRLQTTDTYVENELIIQNEETQRTINCREVVPKKLADGEKVPVVIYVHGFKGNAKSLVSEPEALAADGIAGFTFECCGGIENGLSDGKDIYPSHYSSRVSDLLAAFEYVLTLSYVDPSQVYIYGQSYGGATCMIAAPLLKDKIAGMILESTGISKEGLPLNGDANGALEKYTVSVDAWEDYVVQYEGNIILCHSEGDTTLPMEDNAVYTTEVYNRRANGTMTLYRCPDGAHAFNMFSEEGKEITLDAIRALVLGK